MMNSGNWYKEFIGSWQSEVRRVWEELPKEMRKELLNTLGLMPTDIKGWRGLIDQAMEQVRFAAGDKQQVAIVGPVNVGKSTLYNSLIRHPTDKARVSAVPGTTRHAREADAGLFVIVDTPGADAVGAVGVEEKESALRAASNADLLLVLFDATHGIRTPEQELFNELMESGKPVVVALNKMDLVKSERSKVLGKAAVALGLSSEQLIPLSAKKGEGINRIMIAIAKNEPGIVSALGEALPHYRWDLAQTVIGRAASTAAAIAITPLPFLDFFPLTGVQIAMVLSIARIYAYKITFARARELLTTFGVALIGRTLFYELSKFGGPPGWLLAAGVAAGTTVALGYGSVMWFDKGEQLSRATLDRVTRTISNVIIERLKVIGRRKPKQVTLRERVKGALENLPDPSSTNEFTGQDPD
jgi:small GTP-binding protein